MLNAKFFEEMSSKLNEAVANSPAKDFEKNARALLAQGFAKLDLVTREEYEVLAQRLEKLEGASRRFGSATLAQYGTGCFIQSRAGGHGCRAGHGRGAPRQRPAQLHHRRPA